MSVVVGGANCENILPIVFNFKVHFAFQICCFVFLNTFMTQTVEVSMSIRMCSVIFFKKLLEVSTAEITTKNLIQSKDFSFCPTSVLK